MKTTTNAKELRSLKACEGGYDVYFAVHGEKETKFSECLESNSFSDVLWLLDAVHNKLSDIQSKDLRLLACDWAESVLHLFEEKHPNDDRPRNAIESSRLYVNGKISLSELNTAARAAADTAADAAAYADAAYVAYAAYADAAYAAYAAYAASAYAASANAASAYAYARDNQAKDLMNLFLKWEAE